MEGWEAVSTGCSDAVVRRSPDGRTYAKSSTTPKGLSELEAERDRLLWLADAAIPSAAVLGWSANEASATLTMSAVPGVPLSDLPAEGVARAVDSLADFLAELHEVPTDACPFDRWLAVTVPLARLRVDAGEVDEGDFDTERAGSSAQQLLAELLELRGRAAESEPDALVVCHGDACLPNFLADPDTGQVVGMVDVGRLGVADRHLDLGLVTRSLGATELNQAYGPDAVTAFLARYPVEADPFRLDFYRLLDEFF